MFKWIQLSYSATTTYNSQQPIVLICLIKKTKCMCVILFFPVSCEKQTGTEHLSDVFNFIFFTFLLNKTLNVCTELPWVSYLSFLAIPF